MAATVSITIAGVGMKFLKEDYLKIISRPLVIFETILSMCITQGRKSSSGAQYCYPKQKWLGEQAKVCRKTANEAVAYYDKNGIFNKQQRAPRHGVWRSCLYTLGRIISKATGCANAYVQAALKSVTPGLHISKETNSILKNKQPKSDFAIKLKAKEDDNVDWNEVCKRREALHRT